MSKNNKFERSQKAHYSLMSYWHKKGTSSKDFAYGNYHADCLAYQRKLGRVLTKPERKKLFSWEWNYEVKNKITEFPML